MSVIEELKALSKIQVAFGVLAASVAALGGAAAGYSLALNRLTEQLKEEADQALQVEINKTRDIYESRYKKFTTPGEAFDELHKEDMQKITFEAPDDKAKRLKEATEYLLQYQGDQELIKNFLDNPIEQSIKGEPELVEVAQNVFTDHDITEVGDWDYDRELSKRDPDFPYVVSAEEFAENEFDYEEVHFTYYQGDGVLANMSDEPVDEVVKIVGENNLLLFGHGSNDENIVFVRNVPLKLNIEVVRSVGKYAEEVGGFIDDEPVIRHSGASKFREYHG